MVFFLEEIGANGCGSGTWSINRTTSVRNIIGVPSQSLPNGLGDDKTERINRPEQQSATRVF